MVGMRACESVDPRTTVSSFFLDATSFTDDCHSLMVSAVLSNPMESLVNEPPTTQSSRQQTGTLLLQQIKIKT